MKKINIVRSSMDFNNIIKTGRVFKNKYFVVYKDSKEKKIYRVGITIPKKTGNAVVRNKIKRQVKSIIDNNRKILNNFDYIIIVRNKTLELKYNEMEKSLIDLFTNEEKNYE